MVKRAPWAAVALAVTCGLVTPARAHVLEYLYIDANVGGSSGGHVALRFDDRVYHFRQHAPGWLRLERTTFDRFRYVYAVLDNRTIRGARISVSDETYGLLLDRFNDRFLAEESQFAALTTLDADRTLIETLLRHESGAMVPPPLPLPGAGLFDHDGRTSSTVAALRDGLRRARGADVLERRMVEITTALRALEPEPPVEAGDVRDFRPRASTFATRYVELATELAALETFSSARALRSDARMSPPGAVATVAERDRLRVVGDRLRARLVVLPWSARPDWGHAMLVGLARLQAIDETVAGGRFVFVDAFPADARTLPGADSPGRRLFLEEQRADLAGAFAEARASLATEDGYATLEETGDRLVEVAAGIEGDRPIRVVDGHLLPARGEAPWLMPAPAATPAMLRRALAAVAGAERERRAALRASYGYDLVFRSCVSEIFATVDAALGRDGSQARLGGWIAPADLGTVAPWSSFEVVQHAYTIDAIEEIPSYRRARLARMYESEWSLAAYFREANTLTSTIHRPVGDDGAFVFFTDDVILARPLYGLVNLAAGLGEVAVGLVAGPLDRGARLWSGAKSVVSSLPELAFVNVRKGTMAYGLRALDDVRSSTGVAAPRSAP